jgi:D-sedoheptulose 7-phosphate isomerase
MIQPLLILKDFFSALQVGQIFKNELAEIAGERGMYLAGKLQQALPVISLTAHSALITAVANDTDASLIFANK